MKQNLLDLNYEDLKSFLTKTIGIEEKKLNMRTSRLDPVSGCKDAHRLLAGDDAVNSADERQDHRNRGPRVDVEVSSPRVRCTDCEVRNLCPRSLAPAPRIKIS